MVVTKNSPGAQTSSTPSLTIVKQVPYVYLDGDREYPPDVPNGPLYHARPILKISRKSNHTFSVVLIADIPTDRQTNRDENINCVVPCSDNQKIPVKI